MCDAGIWLSGVWTTTIGAAIVLSGVVGVAIGSKVMHFSDEDLPR
jgi:hypothetical protein